jgi:pyruvate,water dikinase
MIADLSSRQAADAERFGAKAANLARLGHAGLPVVEGFCVDAEAYRRQLAALGKPATSDPREILALRIALHDSPVTNEVRAPFVRAWRALVERTRARTVVRSSALVEDRFGASYAGQFESYLGLETQEEVEVALRSCWAALWSARVQRYMAMRDASPDETAMAVLVQPLVAVRAAGGALSRTAEGDVVINATAGLGASIAQGEVVPDRFVVTPSGRLLGREPGRRYHAVACQHRGSAPRIFEAEPCLDPAQALQLAELVRRVEALMQIPVEIEWAMDDEGFKLLQARPLVADRQPQPHPSGLASSSGLKGHPAGVGWAQGRACVVSCECELERVGPGDILVTRVAGPSLGRILPRVGGVVAELGGSTSHLASLARERGLPMVLGVLDATQRIPDGVQVAVDGVAGVVRWQR